MTTIKQWYAVRTAPSAQRMAKAMAMDIDGFPERRIGESIVERECRRWGFDVYMPAYWTMHKHHRRNTILEKRYPLFIGYAFVRIANDEFERVRNRVDSITAFLRTSRYGAPVVFAEPIISRLMLDEFESRQEFLYEKQRESLALTTEAEKRLKNERRAINHRISSATRRKRASMTELAIRHMEGLMAEDKARLQAIERELKALENVDEAVAMKAKVG